MDKKNLFRIGTNESNNGNIGTESFEYCFNRNSIHLSNSLCFRTVHQHTRRTHVHDIGPTPIPQHIIAYHVLSAHPLSFPPILRTPLLLPFPFSLADPETQRQP